MLDIIFEALFGTAFGTIIKGIGAFVWWAFAGFRGSYRERYANEDLDFRHGVTGMGVLVLVIFTFLAIHISRTQETTPPASKISRAAYGNHTILFSTPQRFVYG